MEHNKKQKFTNLFSKEDRLDEEQFIKDVRWMRDLCDAYLRATDNCKNDSLSLGSVPELRSWTCPAQHDVRIVFSIRHPFNRN